MSWDGTELPGGAELLEIARVTLLESVMPGLEGDARFKALMVANAMAIAARELRSGTGAVTAALRATGGDARALCAEIRAGSRDGDAGMAEALLRLATERCRISAPRAAGKSPGFTA